jgi:hypothetical protein
VAFLRGLGHARKVSTAPRVQIDRRWSRDAGGVDGGEGRWSTASGLDSGSWFGCGSEHRVVIRGFIWYWLHHIPVLDELSVDGDASQATV